LSSYPSKLTWSLGFCSVVTSYSLEIFTFHTDGGEQIRIFTFLQVTSIGGVRYGTVVILSTVIFLPQNGFGVLFADFVNIA